jgi:hypothetical protein
MPEMEPIDMAQNYLEIRNEYLQKAWSRSGEELASSIPAMLDGEFLVFQAFGEPCRIGREEILVSGEMAGGAEGLLIAMYASQDLTRPPVLHPLKSFKELPGSMPYQGAFTANAERVLVPYVESIHEHQDTIVKRFSAHMNPDAESGDFSFTLYPLPRIPLYYIFHLPDEELPAGVSCLFASNAAELMPLDGLADVAEYTAKRIIALLK